MIGLKSSAAHIAALIIGAFSAPAHADYAPAPRVGPKKKDGLGQVLAAARLKAHRAKWDGVDLSGVMTRQRRRASERANAKGRS